MNSRPLHPLHPWRSAALILVLLAGGIGVTWTFRRLSTEPSISPSGVEIGHAVTDEGADPLVQPPDPDRKALAASPAQPRESLPTQSTPGSSDDYPFRRYHSASQFLAERWGDRWPEVQSEVAGIGYDLSKINIQRIPSWDRVLDQVRAQLDLALAEDCRSRTKQWLHDLSFPETSLFLDPSYNPAGIVTSAPLREELVAIAQVGNVSIQARVEAWCTELRVVAHSLLTSGAVTRNPVLTPGFAQEKFSATPFVYASILNVDGWSVTLVVRDSQFPQFSALSASIEEAVSLRNSQLRQAIER